MKAKCFGDEFAHIDIQSNMKISESLRNFFVFLSDYAIYSMTVRKNETIKKTE
jgi:hypothetical protein